MAQRRGLNLFGLAFLDAMACGLGAVILLYLIINGNVTLKKNGLSKHLTAQVDGLESQILQEQKNLVEVRNRLREAVEEQRLTRALSNRLLETLKAIEVELAGFKDTTLAKRETVDRLKSDLKALEQETLRLASIPAVEGPPGDRIRAFIGDGERQYLTGLKIGGKRIFVLIDTSASMLDDTVVNVIRRRNLNDEQKLRSPKWQRAVATVEWICAQLPEGSSFQMARFSEQGGPLLPEQGNQWLDSSDPAILQATMDALGKVVPGGGTSLHHGLAALRTMNPRPDNLILITDGLPTQGVSAPKGRTVSSKRRLRLFNSAIRDFPAGLPVNIILFPMEGDPMASSAFWRWAVKTRGSFLNPPEDWP